MKLSIEFDEYEAALLRKARKELIIIAKRKGNKPPTLKEVVKGAVRMGVHSVYGPDFVSEDLLSKMQFDELGGD